MRISVDPDQQPPDDVRILGLPSDLAPADEAAMLRSALRHAAQQWGTHDPSVAAARGA